MKNFFILIILGISSVLIFGKNTSWTKKDTVWSLDTNELQAITKFVDGETIKLTVLRPFDGITYYCKPGQQVSFSYTGGKRPGPTEVERKIKELVQLTQSIDTSGLPDDFRDCHQLAVSTELAPANLAQHLSPAPPIKAKKVNVVYKKIRRK